MARILIVDDNLDGCEMLLRLLKRAGHDPNCVESGREALEFLLCQVPDLVILDAMMPDMDGPDVLRRIRNDARLARLPVVMYSAVSDPVYREHVMRIGANDYWIKTGVSASQMQDRIRELVYQRAG